MDPDYLAAQYDYYWSHYDPKWYWESYDQPSQAVTTVPATREVVRVSDSPGGATGKADVTLSDSDVGSECESEVPPIARAEIRRTSAE